VEPRAGLDDVEKRKFLKVPGLELRPLGRPARKQSLYRLLYPGSCRLPVSILNITHESHKRQFGNLGKLHGPMNLI
jgi:hypothetical protein